MCDCITEIEKKATEKLQADNPFNKPVKKVELKGVTFSLVGNTMSAKTMNELEIELDGQKKRPTMPVVHSFCPFCGEKFAKAS